MYTSNGFPNDPKNKNTNQQITELHQTFPVASGTRCFVSDKKKKLTNKKILAR